MKFIKILTILSTLFFASFSQAKEVRGFYVGAGVGSTGIDDMDDYFEGSDSLFRIDEDGNSYKLIAGYQFNRVIALEAQYTKYGDINFQVPLLQNKTVHHWSPEALSIAANAGYTFNNGLRPFGILGLSMIDLNESKKVLDKETYVALRYGLGLEYTPLALSNLNFRIGYEADFFYADEDYTYHGAYSDYTLSELYDFTLDSFYISVSYQF
ncbi:porin family protein [Photobacterium sp. SDRW27]|uniref:porin family protein n=1 Tax=Photobacterium obscurum TaxID=2829490 RepID=UPI00224396DC|nr:porin family protein [Photobacterium obscurum]MCW8329069.1 porin family protein [Photobacterium obscurum]